MAKFLLVSAHINLSGLRDNVVVKPVGEGITLAEVAVLRAIHGGDEHVHTLMAYGTVDREMSDEYERLLNTYGDVVEKVFPKIAGRVVLPETDDSIPTVEEVALAADAQAKALEAARKKRTKGEKLAAAVAEGVAQTAPAPAPAPAPASTDEVPNLLGGE